MCLSLLLRRHFSGPRAATFAALAILSPCPLATTQLWEADPLARSFIAPGVGFVVESAGDVDGDGVDDGLVTDIGADGGRGSLHVVSSTGAPIHALSGSQPGDSLGHSTAGLGDVDGDGRSDFVVGAPALGAARPGFVRVYSGSTGVELWTIQGEAVNDAFGWVVANAGDVNGDGVNDVVAGAPGHDGAGVDAGKAYALSGTDGSLIHSWAGLAAGDFLGASVGSAGDRDLDGRADVICCAHRAGPSDQGQAYVFSGLDGSTMCTLTSPPAGQQYGNYFSGCAGDVDADGIPDVYVIDYLHVANRGRLYVYSGADCSLIHSIRGPANSQFLFGRVRVGDVDGDGHDDLLTCSGQNTTAGPAAGAIYLHSGATGETIGQFTGDEAGMRVGTDVASVADQDGDGLRDILVGVGRDAAGLGGVLFVSTRPLPPHTYCDSQPNSAGQVAELGYRYSLSLAAAEFELLASGAPPDEPGVFFGGRGEARVPFGDGTRCVAAPVVRLGMVTTDAAGTARLVPNLSAGAGGGVVVGLPWHVQFWFRDPAAGGAGYNLSDAGRFHFRP